MGSWREWVEDHLPWFDAALERQRERRTEAIARHAEVARNRSKRVIAEYQAAEKIAGKAGEALIDEVRRADDQ